MGQRLGAALFAGVLVAAGCSGDDDDVASTSPGDAETTSSTSSTSEPDTSTSQKSTTSTETTGDGSDGSDGSSSTAGEGSTSSPTNPPSAGSTPLDEVRIRVEPVGTFSVPTAFRTHPDGTGYIAEKAGRVRNFATSAVALDIRDLVVDRGEQGFLGIAFDPDGSRLYVSYSDRATGGTSVIAEYAFAGGRADPGSRRELLRVDQPFSNHNGGDIHIGPDGFLYIALGDGGSAGDPQENGQDPSTLLGSILRIDPARPSGDKAYGIPADNPFADGGGAPEVYLYGVRNPWRFAFDPANDDLWVADVGQNAWEEITVLPAAQGRGRGANLGWDQVEGTHRFEGSAPSGAVPPVHEYSHDSGGCSITGGFVYRGSAIPALQGAYLFADLCTTNLRAVRADGRRLVDAHIFDVDAGAVIAFGVDAAGEMLVLSQQGTVYRIEPA